MSDNLHQSRFLTDLPPDVLLKIFSECDVHGVLNLSGTCRILDQVSGEHQTWFNQATRLQIPIPTGLVPSVAELKNWVISWARSDELWVKPRDDGGDRSLNLHWFNMPEEDFEDNWEVPKQFMVANLVPGGRFIVLLYTDGQIDLKEIKSKSEDKWDLHGVAQYKLDRPAGAFYIDLWSQLLTETNLGCPLIAYTAQTVKIVDVTYTDESGTSLLVFLVDHVSGIIEKKQVVELEDVASHDIYGIHARGNTILCFYDCGSRWVMTVSELGQDPALKHFTFNIKSPQPMEIQSFMVSENAVVICGPEGIHLYHIPELSSAEDFSTLSPVWEWPGESRWFCGGVSMTSSQHCILSLQGTSGTHYIRFWMNARGRDPVVVEHRVTGKLPTHLTSIEGYDHLFVMKGRKGLHHDISEEGPYFSTCLVGREELAGGFSAEVEVPEDDDWEEHKISLADFDGRTGRILIGTKRCGDYDRGFGFRIYLANLPL